MGQLVRTGCTHAGVNPAMKHLQLMGQAQAAIQCCVCEGVHAVLQRQAQQYTACLNAKRVAAGVTGMCQQEI